MVRNYKRKTNRAEVNPDLYKMAANDVVSKKLSLRKAAEKYKLNFMSLQRYIKRDNQQVGYIRPRQIFSDELETRLEEYIVNCSRIYYGLTSREVRLLAYEYAVACKIRYPENWNNTKMATEDWLLSFKKRHPNLSLRQPEATSLARATSFNANNVGNFYNNLEKVFKRYHFEGHQVWNVDETGLTTVQKPSKILAEKGKKQVGRTTSAEKGATVTMELAVNAIGNFVPPLFIFPRVHFKSHFISQGPTGCIGVAHPSGWITGTIFQQFMEHFHKHVPSSVDSPVLLLLDNHISHLASTVLDFCKQNGIVLVSFPPHTSHRLQPLDLSVYGPFKKYYYTACSDWMNSHPGMPISIYDIPVLAKEALTNAVTPRNIMSGFAKAGVWPFNRNVYTEQDFLSAYVTDRQLPEANDLENKLGTEVQPSTSTGITNRPTIEQAIIPSTRGTPEGPSTSDGHIARFTPEQVRPYPKAGQRKNNKTARKKVKSSILTDTPVKDALREEEEARNERKRMKQAAPKRKLPMSISNSRKKIQERKTKKKQIEATRSSISSDDEEDCLCIICLESFSNSRSGEKWIQCRACKKWAHLHCGEDDPFYTCIHCLSNLSEDDTDNFVH